MNERQRFDKWLLDKSTRYLKAGNHVALVSLVSNSEILWLGWQAAVEQQKARTA